MTQELCILSWSMEAPVWQLWVVLNFCWFFKSNHSWRTHNCTTNIHLSSEVTPVEIALSIVCNSKLFDRRNRYIKYLLLWQYHEHERCFLRFFAPSDLLDYWMYEMHYLRLWQNAWQRSIAIGCIGTQHPRAWPAPGDFWMGVDGHMVACASCSVVHGYRKGSAKERLSSSNSAILWI